MKTIKLKKRICKSGATLLSAALLTISCSGICFAKDPSEVTVEIAIKDNPQQKTLAFSGMAFVTGDLCSDTFLKPGKVSDFFGFQHLRDVEPNGLGHNTAFASTIARNVLSVLTEDQQNILLKAADEQTDLVDEYGYKRFVLMKAFRRLMDGDLPDGTDGLDMDAIRQFSGELYRIDGEISYIRAEAIGAVVVSLTEEQKSKLQQLDQLDLPDWPTDIEDVPHGVLITTLAGQLFSWYTGNIESDVYFCPERHGTYFGSFYYKDIPAMMADGPFTIPESLTGEMGQEFIDTLDETQKPHIMNLVDLQREDLLAIVDKRREISTLLRGFMEGSTIDKETAVAMVEKYGQLDGGMEYHYATAFANINKTLTTEQRQTLEALRASYNDYECSEPYLYSKNVAMPEIPNTDFLFGLSSDNPENNAPTASDLTISTRIDTEVQITLAGSDADGDELTYAVATEPQNGTFSGTAPNLTYTPNTGFSGSDSFTYTVSDGKLQSDSATVSITVSDSDDPANHIPTASDIRVATDMDTAVSITLTGSDADGDTLTYTVSSDPQSGTLSGTAPNLTYTPNTEFTGNDTFTYTVSDGKAESNTATVSIVVSEGDNPDNTVPAATNISITTTEDTAASIILSGTDADGDTLSFNIESNPQGGVLEGSAPNLTYTPNSGFTGDDSFTYTVSDGQSTSLSATVSITVSDDDDPVNSIPVAANISVYTKIDTDVVILLTGSDADGDALTYTVATDPQNGVITGTAPNLTYTPNPGFAGSDSFTYTVSDGTAESEVATVDISVSDEEDNDDDDENCFLSSLLDEEEEA